MPVSERLESDQRFFDDLLFDSSVAESANKVVRQVNMRTNHQAPSRDVAQTLAETAALTFVAASLMDNTVIKSWFMVDEDAETQDRIRFDYHRSQQVQSSSELEHDPIYRHLKAEGSVSAYDHFRAAKAATLPNGDRCLLRHCQDFRIGRVVSLLVPTTGRTLQSSLIGEGFALVEFARLREELGSTGFVRLSLDPHPSVVSTKASQRRQSYCTISSQESFCPHLQCLLGVASVQHDCASANCALSASKKAHIERIDTGGLENALTHRDDRNWLLSTITQRSHDLVAPLAPPIPAAEDLDSFVQKVRLSQPPAQTRNVVGPNVARRGRPRLPSVAETDSDSEDQRSQSQWQPDEFVSHFKLTSLCQRQETRRFRGEAYQALMLLHRMESRSRKSPRARNRGVRCSNASNQLGTPSRKVMPKMWIQNPPTQRVTRVRGG
ncbi:BZ3500_MvSof-1268-A1-R1_Chr12-2g03780 [Microbotryum saponariae]|uniref:BZ3500_MvSof-1268-A1-R1_Chr12-2g03780 protein n=1 Tax=Microbotryum saponariae TaxID=289078 RepID=A0A2X0MJ55_9BASI|nr:BZ3500_MvSof-1268-A1-R1_Chr12-2g03780 [Microbotryum saponariae]